MENLACPRCGSLYFLSSRTANRYVFQVDSQWQPWLVNAERSIERQSAPIVQLLCCGACSWQGQLQELVPSSQ